MPSARRGRSVEYEYAPPGQEDLLARVVDLEVQLRRFAGRVEQLVKQRRGLIGLLRSIKDNGGCNTRHWRSIDRLLAVTREWKDEDSGRH